MKGFKEMDERFVNRSLDRSYRMLIIPKMEKSRLWNFWTAIIWSLLCLVSYVAERRLSYNQVVMLVLFWLGFAYIDHEVKFLKLVEALGLGKESGRTAKEFEKDSEREAERALFIVLTPLLIIFCGFVIWLIFINVHINLENYPALFTVFQKIRKLFWFAGF